MPPILDPQFLIQTFGYIGVFAFFLAAYATVLLPIPALGGIIVAAYFLDPFLTAPIAALGAALGELVGYSAGRGGRILAERYKERVHKWIERLSRYTTKAPLFLFVFGFSLLPVLPFDVVGIFSGMIRYDTKKFVLATFLGKLLLFLLLGLAVKLLKNTP